MRINTCKYAHVCYRNSRAYGRWLMLLNGRILKKIYFIEMSKCLLEYETRVDGRRH